MLDGICYSVVGINRSLAGLVMEGSQSAHGMNTAYLAWSSETQVRRWALTDRGDGPSPALGMP